jgi:hypothetical protein
MKDLRSILDFLSLLFISPGEGDLLGPLGFFSLHGDFTAGSSLISSSSSSEISYSSVSFKGSTHLNILEERLVIEPRI